MYRNVHARFWSDPKIKALSIEERYLFLYLVTNEHSHVSGIYRLPRILIHQETLLNPKKQAAIFVTLSAQNLAHYDSETEQVFVTKMLCYQGNGPKIRTHIEKHLRDLHFSELKALFAKTYSYTIDTPSIGYRYPTDRHTAPVAAPDPVSDRKRDARGKPKNQAVILSENFQSTERMRSDALAVGINGHFEDCFGAWRDHHMNAGTVIHHPEASFRTWIKNARKWNPEYFEKQANECRTCHGKPYNAKGYVDFCPTCHERHRE